MIRKTVFGIVSDQTNYDPSELSTRLSLFDDLSMDGEEFLTLISILEDEFDIVFDENAIEDIDTLSDVIKVIEENL